MTVPDGEPMTGVDNAWRRLGTADNLTTITGVLSFDSAISYEEFCERLEERLLRFERFRQRPRGRGRQLRNPYWESVADFDVETHVTEVALPEPGDTATFQRFVSDLMSRPLDERRPLWEAFLVEDAGEGDGNAAVFRINHSVGDGFALLSVLLGLADDPDAIELPMGVVPEPPSPDEFREEPIRADGSALEGADPAAESDESGADGADQEGERSDPTEGAEPPADRAATYGPDAGAITSEESPVAEGDAVEDDSGLSLSGGSPLAVLSLAAKGVTTAWNLLTMEDEVETSLRGDIGTAKRAGWTGALDLEEVKAIADAYDATLNDVLLAVLAGAFRRLLADRGEDVDAVGELRVSVPVNLKPMSERDESLGNYFGLAFVPLPVGTDDLAERIAIINDRMDEQKAGIEAYLMYLTLRFGGASPDPVFGWLLEQFEDQATGVVTNVPGPTESFEFGGHEVTDLMFWVPQAHDQGIGVSIFSYDGDVRLGIAGDANLLPEPDRLADAFEGEVERLFAAVE